MEKKKLTQERFKRRGETMKTLTGILFITGLILAGSEGQYFPWVNLAGVGIFSLSPVVAWRWT